MLLKLKYKDVTNKTKNIWVKFLVFGKFSHKNLYHVCINPITLSLVAAFLERWGSKGGKQKFVPNLLFGK